MSNTNTRPQTSNEAGRTHIANQTGLQDPDFLGTTDTVTHKNGYVRVQPFHERVKDYEADKKILAYGSAQKSKIEIPPDDDLWMDAELIVVLPALPDLIEGESYCCYRDKVGLGMIENFEIRYNTNNIINWDRQELYENGVQQLGNNILRDAFDECIAGSLTWTERVNRAKHDQEIRIRLYQFPWFYRQSNAMPLMANANDIRINITWAPLSQIIETDGTIPQKIEMGDCYVHSKIRDVLESKRQALYQSTLVRDDARNIKGITTKGIDYQNTTGNSTVKVGSTTHEVNLTAFEHPTPYIFFMAFETDQLTPEPTITDIDMFKSQRVDNFYIQDRGQRFTPIITHTEAMRVLNTNEVHCPFGEPRYYVNCGTNDMLNRTDGLNHTNFSKLKSPELVLNWDKPTEKEYTIYVCAAMHHVE